MKRSTLLVAGIFLLGMALGIGSTAWTAERHPQIRAAEHDLASAKYHLQRAARDFGGQRVKAIALIDQAQEELHEALKFDRN